MASPARRSPPASHTSARGHSIAFLDGAVPLLRSWSLPPQWPRQVAGSWRGSLSPSHMGRSEEHTSELQSLMRISYAVFCLKKKKSKAITSVLTITKVIIRAQLLHTYITESIYSIST